jgi:hypothetical protein
MRDVLAGRGRVPYGDMDDSQLLELRDTMRKASSCSSNLHTNHSPAFSSLLLSIPHWFECYNADA